MSNIKYSFDKRLEHRASGAAALTATTTLATISERAAQRTRYVTMLAIESMKISANNESYKLVVECSNDDFTTVEVAAILSLGATEVRESQAPDNVAGDYYEVFWSTQINDISYIASRIRLVVSGTSPSAAVACHSGVEAGV